MAAARALADGWLLLSFSPSAWLKGNTSLITDKMTYQILGRGASERGCGAVERGRAKTPADMQLLKEKLSDEALVSRARCGLHHPSHLTGAGPSLSQQALNAEDLEDRRPLVTVFFGGESD